MSDKVCGFMSDKVCGFMSDKVFYVGKKYWLCQKRVLSWKRCHVCMLEKVFCCMHAYSKEQLDGWALSGIPNIFFCPELRRSLYHS